MESTLNMAYYELQAEVGFYLGFGRGDKYGEDTWDADKAYRIDSVLKSGLRQVYYPSMQVDGKQRSYRWSWLRPKAALLFPSGSQDINLPDDFGGIEGRITYTGSTAGTTWPLQVANPGEIRELYTITPSMTGRPLKAAQEVIKGTTGISSTRTKLLVFPQSDAAYTLNFTYYVNPDFLTGQYPYAYGGPQHAETLKASVLAAAELYQDNERGPMWQNFQDRLAASMDIDQQLKPQMIGYNRDNSDLALWPDRPNQHGYASITVAGVQY